MDTVEELLKLQEDFEKTLATQEEKFSLLNRETKVEETDRKKREEEQRRRREEEEERRRREEKRRREEEERRKRELELKRQKEEEVTATTIILYDRVCVEIDKYCCTYIHIFILLFQSIQLVILLSSSLTLSCVNTLSHLILPLPSLRLAANWRQRRKQKRRGGGERKRYIVCLCSLVSRLSPVSASL